MIDQNVKETNEVEILIAEDSSTQALSLQYLLEGQGYRVVVCENGRIALEAARQRKPTLVISDVVMPELDGYGLCRAMKSDPELADVPLLLVTTLNDPEDVLRGLEAGADSFILKPYDDPFLLNRVRFVLLHQQLRRTDRADMGVEITFRGHRHFITSDRLQILNLLLSTYEAAIQRNQELRRSEEELREANAALSATNARLQQEIQQRELAEAQVRKLSQELLEASEAQLQRSEQRYRQLLDVVPAAIYATDGQGRIQEYNQTAAELWGRTPRRLEDGAAFYRDFEIAPAGENAEGGRDRAVRTLANGEAMRNTALEIRRPDGTRLDVLVNTAPRPDRDGQAQGAIHCLVDVTELTRAQRQLETHRRLAQATLDALSTYICVLDAEGTIIAVNDAWRTYVSSHPEAAEVTSIGANYLEAWESSIGVDRAQAEVFSSALRDLIAGRRSHVVAEYFCPHASQWILARAACFVVGDGDGEARYVIAHEDITERKQAEEKLKESTALMRIAGDAARIGGWVYYPGENRLMWSPEVAEIRGVEPGVALDVEHALEHYAPEWRPVMKERFERCVDEGTPFDEEVQIVDASGRRVWVRTIGTALVEDGQVVRLQGAFQDISAQKEKEARIAEIAARLTTTLESITDGFFTVDHDWRFTYVNREAERILRARREELLGKGLWEMFPDAVGSEFEHRYRETVGHGKTNVFESFYAPLGIWVEVHAYPSDGGMAVYFRDVTQRKQAEVALRTSEERLRLAVAASGLGTWRWNTTRDEVIVSDEAKRMFGLAPDEGMTASAFFDAIHPDDLDRVRERVDQTLGERSDFRADFRIVLPDGSIRWMAALGRASLDEEQNEVVIEGINLDITERKRAEQELRELNEQLEQRVASRTEELAAAMREAEAANEAKSLFLATMSHEIRTPMNGIVGMVDVLAHSRLTEHQHDAVRTIRDSAFGLLHLIDDILDFSKIEAGKIELENVDVSLVEAAESVCDALTPLATTKDVDLFLYAAPDVPARVLADPMRLRQILFNLVGNAVKFSGGRAQRGRVELRLEVAQAQPLRVRITVSDNGIGMSEQAQRTLFQSFRQGEVSTTRRFGGSGLGLAICKRLIELMGGRIAVASRERIGSVFAVELPLTPVAGEDHEVFPDLQGLSFIVVEGAALRAEDICAYLRSAGADAVPVPTDEAALAAIEQSPTAILVHDDPSREVRERWLARFAQRPDVRHLLIGVGRRRVARIADANLVTIDGNSMRRRSLLHAAAVVAGRASPEIGDQQRPSMDPPTGPTVATTVAEARARGQLILVAEDDATNQKVLLRQLELLGYAAEVASDGLEALRLWSKGGYALVLTDLHMPGLDGYGLAAAIRDQEDPHHRIPIIALTANALRGEASRAKAAGFDEYLTKPMQLAGLRQALEAWLPRRDEPESGSGAASSSLPAAPATGAIDLEVLKSIVGDDEATLRELLQDYEGSVRLALEEIDQAFASDEAEQIGAVAHRLKSSSRAVGAVLLGDLCAELENACKKRDQTEIARVVAAMGNVAEDVLRSVHRALDE